MICFSQKAKPREAPRGEGRALRANGHNRLPIFCLWVKADPKRRNVRCPLFPSLPDKVASQQKRGPIRSVSSAMLSKSDEIVRPSALAVFMLMASLKFGRLQHRQIGGFFYPLESGPSDSRLAGIDPLH